MIYVDFTRYFCKWPTFWPTFIIFSVYKNNHAAYKPRGYHILYGGDKEDRTPDLLHAMQALSQLSYTPMIYVLLFMTFIISQMHYFINTLIYITFFLFFL